MSELTHLSLFTGIGGLDLAAEAAGFVTVGQCEWADYPTKVLEKHWPDVPRWRDIRTLTKESFYGQTGLRTVDVISGGFPCQPFSAAGQRRGEEDDRYLWPEMLRVIQEIRPTWVVGENVAGIVSMALDTVLSDLEDLGYACQALIVPACGVDAPHRRERCAILAYTGTRLSDGTARTQDESKSLEKLERSGCFIPNTKSGGKQRSFPGRRQAWRLSGDSGWPVEPNVGRVANGVPDRVDRLKCLGNAVVPQQLHPIFACIYQIESLFKEE